MPKLLITAGVDMHPVSSIEDIDCFSYITLHGQMMFHDSPELCEEWIWAHSVNWLGEDAKERVKKARINQLAAHLNAKNAVRAGVILRMLIKQFQTDSKIADREPSRRRYPSALPLGAR